MRVTQKGQVTIPLPIRQALGIGRSTEVEFVLEGDHAILRREYDPDAVAERFEAYRGSADAGLSTEQILALTRS